MFLALVSVLTVFAAPVFAQEGEQAPETTSEEMIQPAVVVPPAADDEVEVQWTYKFLIPTGLLLAALVVFVTVVQYFVRVARSRYSLVE